MTNKLNSLLMHTLIVISILCLSYCFSACTQENEIATEDEITTEALEAETITEIETETTTEALAFDYRLTKELKSNSNNYAVSPISLKLGLGVLSEGATGATRSAIRSLININNEDELNQMFEDLSYLTNDLPLRLYIVNDMWINEDREQLYPITEKFSDALEAGCNSQINSTQYRTAAEDINNQVSEKTSGKISNVMGKANLEALSWFINAFTLKGSWVYPFNSTENEEGWFTDIRGNTKAVTFMRQTNNFSFYEDSGTKILRMPLKDRDGLSMFFVLNNGNGVIDISNYIDKMEDCAVDVWLPKFDIESVYALNRPLCQLGLCPIFYEENAGLGNIFEGQDDFHISASFHKVCLTVEENGIGTDADIQVATPNEVEQTEAKSSFKADKPFSFILWDEQTNSAWLIGEYAYAMSNGNTVN